MLINFTPSPKKHKLLLKDALFVYGFKDITEEINGHPVVPIEVMVYLENLKTQVPHLIVNFFLIGEHKEKLLIVIKTESELAKTLAAFNSITIKRLFLNEEDCKVVFKCISTNEVIE